MNDNPEEQMKNGEESEDTQKDNQSDIEEKSIKTEKPILIKADAYKTIILYASRYANQAIPRAEWKEIYGILIGYSTEDVVYVEKAEALTFGHSTDVQLDERHYGFIAEIEEKYFNEGKGYYMVGWFHSHPGLGLFFSFIDLRNQLWFQTNNEDFFGLVFDHTLLGKKKQEKMEGTEFITTKYDTGFEIYRIDDVEIDINDPKFDNNYHKVDYLIDGLNKFFFANVLTELSVLATSGKPLQSAYKEDYSSYTPQFTNYPEKTHDDLQKHSGVNQEDISRQKMPELSVIPNEIEDEFEIDEFFRKTPEILEPKKDEISQKFQKADKLIFEGNLAFRRKNSFEGVEKYKKGLEIYKKMNEIDKFMESLSKLSEKCLYNNHYPLAERNSEELFKVAEAEGSLFYMGGAKFMIGFIKTIKNNFKEGLEDIQQAAIFYEKAMDYYGTALCNNKIGSIYSSQLNDVERASLFFLEAMKNFNKAIYKIHHLRKSIWNSPKQIKEKIISLKKKVRENLNQITDQAVKGKIEMDLKNFE